MPGTNPDTPAVSNKPGIERHFQSLMLAVIIAALLWFGSTTQAGTVALAELKVEVKGLKGEVSSLRTAASDRYTSADAKRDHDTQSQQSARLQGQIDNLSGYVRDLENRLHEVEMKQGSK